ncbi:MAG: hypothetical protein WCS37_18645 [Chloroflexota bacterium]
MSQRFSAKTCRRLGVCNTPLPRNFEMIPVQLFDVIPLDVRGKAVLAMPLRLFPDFDVIRFFSYLEVFRVSGVCNLYQKEGN